ncbi:hypothetical protein LQ948_17110 [Jiella sp. MQZ9-1]|uniref:Uncharacterized protein n=1 Tax=Jiella flava TaxID=2816857 RepID=A0A939FYJ9_9HYPH|nr:hypothetical protein [Jiella flava]MBO0662560.1 hypothetical protein [Jiella flava]MCD2472931.1 hypothetical protein [Jiella flava]
MSSFMRALVVTELSPAADYLVSLSRIAATRKLSSRNGDENELPRLPGTAADAAEAFGDWSSQYPAVALDC